MKIHTNSRFLRIMTSLSVLCAFMMFANPLQASTLSNAQYMRPIDIINSGAASTNNVVLFDPDTLGMLNSGFINSSLTGSAITDLANRDLIYMPKAPVRYKLVQYLESNGTQYINTGVVATTGTQFIIDAQATQQLTTWKSLIGAQTPSCQFKVNYNPENNKFYIQGGPGGSINISFDTNRHTFTVNNNNLYVGMDGNVQSISSGDLSPIASYPMYIFASNNGDVSGNWRVYSCQIYQAGVLVRDYVPVERTTDGVLGLYDRINGVFYTNSGTGTFLTSQYTSDYYLCEYLYTNGGQYIDTGVKPSALTQWVTNLTSTSAAGTWHPMGALYNISSNSYYFFRLSFYNSIDFAFGTGYTVQSGVTPSTSTRYTLDSNNPRGYCNTNNVIKTMTVQTTGFPDLTIYLMAQHYNNSAGIDGSVPGYYYSSQILNNGKMQRNFIAVYNFTTQKAGMFDNVENLFYNNVGSGDFTYKLAGQDGTWCLYLPAVAGNTTLQERLYISTKNLNSQIAYFPGSQGMTVNRSSGLTLAGSDDWNFTIDGHSISGNGGYLFRYGSDLSASLQGNTVTFKYGTITIPTTVQVHNTSWAYYWGTLASGYTFVSNHGTVSNNTSTKKIGASTVYTYQRPFISLRTTLSSNPYNLMVVRNDLQANTTRRVGYATSDTYEPTTYQTVSSAGALTLQSLPTGSTVYPLIYVHGSSAISNQGMGVDAYMIAFAKPDNPAQYSTLSKYGSNATAIINRSSEMLNDLGAVITLATRCTGDFMWQCVSNSTFTTALNSSPYKSIITSSIDWAKALAWNTGSYSQTAPTGASVELSTTQVVPIGDHTYSFRKEDNAISIYVDGMLVRGGIFNETSYYSALTSLGYTYSDVASYNPSATITLAQDDAMLFVNNMEISKNDSVVGKWSWTHTDTFTFPDQSGNGNTGNPSFRTEPYGSVNNGQNLSVNLGAYSPANTSQYIPPGGTTDSDFDGLIPNNQQPDQNVDIENIKNIPFAEVFEDILAAGGIPSQLFWLPLIMTLAIAAMMVTYNFTRDALIACIAGDVVIGLGIALSVLYTVPLVIGIITTIVLLVKRKTISL